MSTPRRLATLKFNTYPNRLSSIEASGLAFLVSEIQSEPSSKLTRKTTRYGRMGVVGYELNEKANGNVYNLLFSFLEDTKLKSDGT